MKYFIGYLIDGKAGHWHRELVQEISEKFNTEKIFDHIPAHMTIFRPFETENIQEVENVLEHWIKTHPLREQLTILDFDRFGTRVIVAKITHPEGLDHKIADLQKALEALPGMPGSDYFPWNPHATILHRVETETLEQVWDYVSALPKPHFKMWLDNITIFALKSDGHWQIEKTFPIGRPNDPD